MTKKNWFQIAALVALCAVYVYYFTDWFRPHVIPIHSTSRMTRRRPGANPTTMPVTFSFDARFQIKELKVVPLLAWQTNHNAMPVWHLISDSNSVALKTFVYGQGIGGMRPAVPGTRPEPLEPNVSYHLSLKSGSAKGEHDFDAKPVEATP